MGGSVSACSSAPGRSWNGTTCWSTSAKASRTSTGCSCCSSCSRSTSIRVSCAADGEIMVLPKERDMTRVRTIGFLVALGGCVGCAVPSQPARVNGGQTAGMEAARVEDLMSARDHDRLAAIVAERAAAPTDGGYRIGPDDLLEIRIPDLLDAGGRLPPAGPV